MAKRKARFNSLSTPGKKQDCSNYLVELVFLRKNHGKRLQPNFWRLTKYKFQYKREIQACRRFIKKYGEAVVLSVAIANVHIKTWTNFAQVEFLLQQKVESNQRRSMPKDHAPVASEKTEVTVDLRKDKKTKKNKLGLFDRLKELNNG